MMTMKDYLQSLIEKGLTNREYVSKVMKFYKRLKRHTKVEPDCAIGDDGTIMLAYDDGKHHLDFDLKQPMEVFLYDYRDKRGKLFDGKCVDLDFKSRIPKPALDYLREHFIERK